MTVHEPFYRWAATRWACIVAGLALAITLSPWVPSWHDTPSLHYLHRALPWPVLSVGFLVYVALLAYRDPLAAAVAYLLGAFFWLCELIALCATVEPHKFNPFFLVGVMLVVLFHLAAARLALYEWTRRKGTA